jgi:hypothetical protein
MGRRAIFRGKEHGRRVQAIITKAGGKAFEERRKELAKLAGWKVADVSDADTVEYMARGPAATRAYLGVK